MLVISVPCSERAGRNIGSVKQRNKGLYCADIDKEKQYEGIFLLMLIFRQRAITIERKNKLRRIALVMALLLIDMGRKIENMVEPVERRFLRFVTQNADMFTFNFRFKQEFMDRLLACLMLPPNIVLNNGIWINSQEALLITLHLLSHPCRLGDKEEMLGYERTELCRIRKHVMVHIVRTHGRRITDGIAWHMPYLQECKAAMQRFKSNLHPDGVLFERTANCCLMVDGWRWNICRPGRVIRAPHVNLQRQVYSGFTKQHNLTFITACSPYGLIVDFSGPYAGRYNDLVNINQSRILLRFRDALVESGHPPDDFAFIADSIFANGPNIRAMVRRAYANAEEMVANGIDQKSRLPIEWTNGQLTTNWKALLFKNNLKIQLNDLKTMARCCAILTNALILFQGCKTQKYFKDKNDPFSLTMPTPEEYFA